MFGPQTASALERDLGISRHRLVKALSDLDDAGAVRAGIAVKHGERRWRARSSEAAVLRLRKGRRSVGAQQGGRNRPAHPLRGIELGEGLRHLPSREATRQRLAELVAAARHCHLTMNPESSFDAASLRAAAPLDKRLQSRGVQIRIVGVGDAEPELLVPYGGVAKEALLTYREAESVPMKLIIIDMRVALFPVDPGDFDQGYLEVSQQPVVESLASSFEQHWAAAHDLSETLMPAFELSPREEAVIALLTLGHTDARVARELRISERSVSNILRSVMDRFGVENRFQLGVALGTLRMAPSPPGMPALRPNDNNGGMK